MANDNPVGESQHLEECALIVIDVQKGFDDVAWGPRNNPSCEENIERLVTHWSQTKRPLIFVRHDSKQSGSPLEPGQEGNEFKDFLQAIPDVLVIKNVNSAFLGKPDLHQWLQERNIRDVAICGITTNHCCETTARVAGNLGYRTHFVIDATHTFDRSDLNGVTISAEELSRVSAANLKDEFAEIVMTQHLLHS